MATLAPKQISPLIRFGRYAALISGVIYGASSMKRLSAKEVVIQEHENKIRVVRDARVQKEKLDAMNLEMSDLAREAGVKAV